MQCAYKENCCEKCMGDTNMCMYDILYSLSEICLHDKKLKKVKKVSPDKPLIKRNRSAYSQGFCMEKIPFVVEQRKVKGDLKLNTKT
tara:strand:- start:280 stop:540 length:261 start_codon:yes stop_codon:yes gene_type:complete